MTGRPLLLFALELEAEPLLWRFGFFSVWDDARRVYVVHPEPWEDERETEIGPADVLATVVGMGPSAAAAATRRLLATLPRPGVVVSVGIAGGLRAGLNVGDVVVPAEVVSAAGRWACSPVPGAASGRLLSVDRPVLDPADKRRLGATFAADVVDMEAASVAAECAAVGVPFAAVKAVCDPVDRTLPKELPDIAPDGRPRFGRLVRAVVKRPRLAWELMRLDRTSRTAITAASRLARSALFPF